MNRKTLIIVAVVVFVLPCVCSVPLIFAEALPDDSDIAQVIWTVFFGLGCVGLPLAAVAAFVWNLQNMTKGRHSASTLAEEMNLARLNETDKLVRRWFGETYRGYEFGITPTVERSHYYNHEGSRRVQATFYLRVALALPEPLGVKAIRGVKSEAGAESFEEAFTTLENAAALPRQTREAMLAFVRKGYPKGLHGTRLRTGEQTRNLWLQDRASLPGNAFPLDVMLHAGAILTHDHPDAAVIDPEQLNGVLDDLIAIAETLEARP